VFGRSVGVKRVWCSSRYDGNVESRNGYCLPVECSAGEARAMVGRCVAGRCAHDGCLHEKIIPSIHTHISIVTTHIISCSQ
jgi:hypothetical protein